LAITAPRAIATSTATVVVKATARVAIGGLIETAQKYRLRHQRLGVQATAPRTVATAANFEEKWAIHFVLLGAEHSAKRLLRTATDANGGGWCSRV